MCRAPAAALAAKRAEFERIGVRLVAIAPPTPDGPSSVAAFNEATGWGTEGLEVYVDEEIGFKRAMWDDEKYKGKVMLSWLLSPAVMRQISRDVRQHGHQEDDVKESKSQIRGGNLVIGTGQRGVVWEFHESTRFEYASAEDILVAAQKISEELLSSAAQKATPTP